MSSTSTIEPKEDPPLVAKLRSLLNRSTRIEITDGRLFVGQFMCIDHAKNIILSGTYESRPYSDPPLAATANEQEPSGGPTGLQDKNAIAEAAAAVVAASATSTAARESPVAPPPKRGILKKRKEDAERRFVGQIMIPGHHIVKCEMDCSHLRGADSRLKAAKYDADYLKG
ncbi:hypothetical protein EDD11_004711 [Mortierella claussenii]|nr:hypothetical protein EDD11_004711 [Mortierella claussenii]